MSTFGLPFSYTRYIEVLTAEKPKRDLNAVPQAKGQRDISHNQWGKTIMRYLQEPECDKTRGYFPRYSSTQREAFWMRCQTKKDSEIMTPE